MAQSLSPSILGKIQTALERIEEIADFGLTVVKGLLDRVSCPNSMLDLLIRSLALPIKSISL